VGEEEEGEEEVATASAAAKKNKKKKKKAGAEPEAVPEAPQDDQVEAEGEDGEEEDGDEAGVGDAKKKKKKKKKGKGASEAVDPEAEATFQPPPRGQDKPEEAKEEDEGEDDEEDGQEGQDAKKKKKKRGAKKSAAARAAAGGVGSGVDGVATYGVSEEDFKAWCKKALEATANETATMTPEELKKPPKDFWGYKYSGDLRPAFVSKQMKMPAGIMLTDYALDPDGASPSERTGQKEVPVLEGEKLETMRQACKLGREVLDIAARFMRAGVTGDEIDRIVYQACVDRQIYPSPMNYYRFPKSVCVSANEVICHGIPDARPIEEGDIVNLDISIYHKGFHSDLNETFFIGECDEESQRLVRTAYNALCAAAELIRPGTFYRDLGNAISAEAAKNGCAVVTTYCGHGVGELFHGPPKVPHYRKNKAVGIMKPGHVFTVEPMINLGSNGGDRTWPDNWTAVTRDGKRSAQFEQTFLVTESGLEVLTGRLGTNPTKMPDWNPAMFQR